MKRKISMKPQHCERGAWYYEYKGHIEIIVCLNDRHPKEEREGYVHIKVPRYRLQRSLSRMGASRA